MIGKKPAGTTCRFRSKAFLLTVLILIVGVLVFITHRPVISAQAVFIDDSDYFTENYLIQNPGFSSAKRFLVEVFEPSTVRGYYQPLTMISLMIDYTLAGAANDLAVFHKTSLALHIFNTSLVILLLYLLFQNIWIAAAMGLLFGLHPMTVEPIAWVSDRKTLLAAFFTFLCMILYVRFTAKKNLLIFVGSVAAYLLALMSKPTSLPVPLLMLLLDYWPLKRLNKKCVIEKIPFFVLAGIASVVTYISQARAGSVISPTEYGLSRPILIVCHNIIFYLHKVIWPVSLWPYYTFPESLSFTYLPVLACVIATAVLIVLLLVSLRWTRAVLAGWLFFFVALLPTIGIVGFTVVIAADKYIYLPSFGLLIILAALLSWFCSRAGPLKAALKYALVSALVVILAVSEAVATRGCLKNWSDSAGLYKYILTKTPDAVAIHDMLAITLSEQGQYEQAIGHFKEAIRLDPNDADVCNNLGNALKLSGKVAESIVYYHRALRIRPNYLQAHINLGNALQATGRLDEAIAQYHLALAISPDDVKANHNLGIALGKAGRIDEAVGHFDRVLRVNPSFVPSLTKQAELLARYSPGQQGGLDRAVTLAGRAVELTYSKDISALSTLAFVYAEKNEFDKAVSTAQKALELAYRQQDKELIKYIRERLARYQKQSR